MSDTNSTSTLIPRPVTNLINAVTHLTEAIEIGCKGIRDTTAGLDEIAKLVLSQQKERLLSELAPK